jgi:hypothetical protein
LLGPCTVFHLDSEFRWSAVQRVGHNGKMIASCHRFSHRAQYRVFLQELCLFTGRGWSYSGTRTPQKIYWTLSWTSYAHLTCLYCILHREFWKNANRCSTWSRVVSFTRRPLYSRGNDVSKAKWAPGPVWTF